MSTSPRSTTASRSTPCGGSKHSASRRATRPARSSKAARASPSADDHLIEPPHLWVERVPAKYRETCPRVVEVDGRQAWEYEGELTYIPMGSCRPLDGHDPKGYPPAPGTARFDEIRPGCYDPVE